MSAVCLLCQLQSSAVCLHFQLFVYIFNCLFTLHCQLFVYIAVQASAVCLQWRFWILGQNLYFCHNVIHISPALHLKVLYSLQRPWLAIKATQRLNTPCFIPILKESIGQSHATQGKQTDTKPKMSLSEFRTWPNRIFSSKVSCPLNYVIWKKNCIVFE